MNDVQPETEEGLSFKVYTLAELEKRRGDSVAPVIRPSMTVLAAQPKAPSPWLPVAEALLGVLHAVRAWAFMGKGRPPLRDALRGPGAVLALDLRAASKELDYRRLWIGLAAGLGTACVLLFAVLTVAELTDDLKPARTDGSPALMMPPATASPALPIVETAPQAIATVAAVRVEQVDELDELIELDAVVSKPAPGPAAKAKRATAKKLSAKKP